MKSWVPDIAMVCELEQVSFAMARFFLICKSQRVNDMLSKIFSALT